MRNSSFDFAISFQGRCLNGSTSIRGASSAVSRLSAKSSFMQWFNRAQNSPRLVREVRRSEKSAASLSDQELKAQAASIRNQACLLYTSDAADE